MQIATKAFGVSLHGHSSVLIRIMNRSGAYIEVTNYGAKLVSVVVPDKNGQLGDVVLGYASLQDYIAGHRFYGSNPGRYANRINNAEFTIENTTYHLTKTAPSYHLHGGNKGFDSVFWGYRIEGDSVVFSYLSVDGEEGYPGNLEVEICYTWTEENSLIIRYTANTDKSTHVNLTHHSYFNLPADNTFNINNIRVRINSSSFLEVDSNSVPTGKILGVENTVLDFREFTSIGSALVSDYSVLTNAGGIDQCFIIDKHKEGLTWNAIAFDPLSGREMKVLSTYPAMQFYTSNYCESIVPIKSGVVAPIRSAISFEPQYYPDSPNQPLFPCTLLKPECEYSHQIIYQFNLKKD